MSARIREALKTWGEAKRAAQTPPAPVKPAQTKPAYSRTLLAKRIGSPGSGVVIDECDFASIEVISTTEHPAGYRLHRCYGNDGMEIEVVEIQATQAREILESLS